MNFLSKIIVSLFVVSRVRRSVDVRAEQLHPLDRVFRRCLTHGLPAEIQAMADERAKARKEKNWKRSDEFRDALAAAVYLVKDTPRAEYFEGVTRMNRYTKAVLPLDKPGFFVIQYR